MHTKKSLYAAVAFASMLALPACLSSTAVAQQTSEIPRAASTPDTPKNWVGPEQEILAQQLVNELERDHPELVSITIHAVPPGQPADAYTMMAGTFPDRVGNQSSPGDVITAKKGVSQIESKWGTENFGKKVSVVLPLEDSDGNYLPVSIVIAYRQWPESGLIDTDFLAPALRIRESLSPRIANTNALFAPAS
jgi:ABC-type glycerol-3-phosphate transport system substrate-binding protein